MQSTRFLQIAVIAVVGGLIAFLFLNGKSNPVALVNENQEVSEVMQKAQFPDEFDFAKLEADTKAELPDDQRTEIESLEVSLQNNDDPTEVWLKLANRYDELEKPILAGYYYNKVAETDPSSEEYWFKTGKKYFEAQQTVNDSASFAYFTKLSMEAYDKVLLMNPNNFEAKADQAINYIEGTGQPMRGVGLLREILQLDPNNRKAIFYLGVLSIQSGQLDKAAERFEKLVSLGPGDDAGYPFYYRYLGQVYQQLGQNDKALEAYKKYKLLAGAMQDPVPAREAEQLIQSLSRSK